MFLLFPQRCPIFLALLHSEHPQPRQVEPPPTAISHFILLPLDRESSMVNFYLSVMLIFLYFLCLFSSVQLVLVDD